MQTTITRKQDIEKEIAYWKDAKKSAQKTKHTHHVSFCAGMIVGLEYACN